MGRTLQLVLVGRRILYDLLQVASDGDQVSRTSCQATICPDATRTAKLGGRVLGRLLREIKLKTVERLVSSDQAALRASATIRWPSRAGSCYPTETSEPALLYGSKPYNWYGAQCDNGGGSATAHLPEPL